MPSRSLILVRRSRVSARRMVSGAALAAVVVLAGAGRPLDAQVAIKRTASGFNLFSSEQDIEVGQRSAAEIERQMPVVANARTDRFLAGVLDVLAGHVTGPRYPFRVRAVNSTATNALVLPDGTMYVSGGLLQLARSEAELAGLLAHSMSHVVLRHGTARASRAYLAAAGLSALGGLTGGSQQTSQIINAIGGFGMNAAFLSFTTADEYDADALGAELMAKAGYDPVAMATLFATLRREQRRNPGLERFAASHPPPPDRETRIRNLANVLGHGGSREVVGGFRAARWRAAATSPAPTIVWNTATGTVEAASTPVKPDVPSPSSRFIRFTHPDALLIIDHPANWEAHPSGFAVSFAPAGGLVESANGPPHLLQGVIVSYYAPFESEVERWNRSLDRHYAPFEDRSRPRGVLEDATDDLVRQLHSIQPWLSAPTGSARSEEVGGTKGYSVRLSGRSPVTGEVERVTLHTRRLPGDHVVYLACVAPGRRATVVERACARMVQSLRVTDAAANHR